MSYDGLLRKIHGRNFDIKLFLIFFFNGVPNALITCTIVMILYSPPHQHCRLPDYALEAIEENPPMTNITMEYFLPRDDNPTFSKCTKYNRTYEEFVAFWNNTEFNSNTTSLGANATTITCEGDKKYFETYGKISAIMEFDWTCDKTLVKPLAGAIYMAGVTTGTVMGYFSDKFGRRPIFNLFTFLISALLLLLSFANSLVMFLVFLYIAGCASFVNYMAGFVLGTECTIPRRRNFLSISSFVSFSCGYGVTSLVGFLAPDWRWHLRILASFGILFIPNLWLVPESPRWLMACGKVKEARKILKKIAEYNGKAYAWKEVESSIEEETIKLIKEKQGIDGKKSSKIKGVCGETFKNPRMFMILFVMSISWFSLALAYYGLSLSVQALNGNLYINNTIMGLVELPGYALAYLAVKYIGRPLSHGGFMILSGLFILAGAFLSTASAVIATIAGMIGKSLNCAAFYLVYIHTAEIFPTVTRNTFVSLGSTAGRIGSIVAPYFAYLGDSFGLYVPYLTLSIITCVSGFLTLFGLPETRNIELPETVTDTLQLKTLYSKFCKKPDRREKILFIQKNIRSDDEKMLEYA